MKKPFLLPGYLKRWSFAVLLLTAGSQLSSCEKRVVAPAAAPAATATQDMAVSSGQNPFTVAVMRQAYANLTHPATTAPAPQDKAADAALASKPQPDPGDPGDPVEPTHWYMRFKPTDVDQIADLGDLGFKLSWAPLDESAAAANPVNYNSDNIPWVYTAVPVGTALPAHIQQQKLDDLFLFDMDESANPVDPWQPTPDGPPANCQLLWIAGRQRYTEMCAYPGQPNATTQLPPDAQARAASRLRQSGVAPVALYNEAMRLSGHADEQVPVAGAGRAARPQTNYYPSGKILVQDTELGNVPLRGVEVKSRRWFWFGSAFTNDQGDFHINTSYSSLATLSLNFKSGLATTRGLVDGWKFWTAVLPISAGIGEYQNSDIENVNYTITWQGGLSNVGSKGASTWAAATLFNTLAESRDFAIARGLPVPATDINVWLLPDFPSGGAGSTPMLRYIANTSIVSQAIDYILIACGRPDIALIKQILQRQLPDLSVSYGTDQGAMTTRRLRGTLYHELGHTQHYRQVGNNFWTAYISHIVQHVGYGEKSDSGSGRIAISEGWGYYVEHTYMDARYTGTTTSIGTSAIAELENQFPNSSRLYNTYYGDFSQGWAVPGLYCDMTDPSEPARTGVVDNVTAFTPATVFHGLQPDVLTVRDYQAKVQQQTGNLQATALDQLVTSYQW